MANIKELASHWKDFPYSYESRDELPDGDEVWVWDTLNLGLPVLWLKHSNGSFENWVIHTPGYDRPTRRALVLELPLSDDPTWRSLGMHWMRRRDF